MTKTIYSKTHKTLIRRLTKAREEAKLKQEDVAKKLGKTQSYISKIESGQRRIDIVQLKEVFVKVEIIGISNGTVNIASSPEPVFVPAVTVPTTAKIRPRSVNRLTVDAPPVSFV